MRTLSAIIGCASRAHPLNSSRPDPIRPICSLAEQNVYTLQELNALVEIESQKERANLEASQHAAESAMLNAWEEAQGMNVLVYLIRHVVLTRGTPELRIPTPTHPLVSLSPTNSYSVFRFH